MDSGRLYADSIRHQAANVKLVRRACEIQCTRPCVYAFPKIKLSPCWTSFLQRLAPVCEAVEDYNGRDPPRRNQSAGLAVDIATARLSTSPPSFELTLNFTSMPFETNVRNTCIFLGIFIVAFFPNAFHLLLKPFLLPFELFDSPISSTSVTLRTCDCCPPLSCYPRNHRETSGPDSPTMSWFQKSFTLPPKTRGSYLVTDHVVHQLPEIKDYKVGLLNLFIQHTSCALSLNENWDEEVREDMSDALDRIAPEDKKGNLYRHSAEGLDDMPAHIKSALIGASVTVPITNGKLNTGTWQGIWYLEFRASKHSRKVVATIQGEKA